jgi:hypothetical protein
LSTVTKHTSESNDNQLSLFSASDFQNVPAPELIARGGNGWGAFPLQREHGGKALWAVQDWLAGITHSKRPRNVWDMVQKRHPELSTKVGQLPYTAKNGKSYDMDYADDTTLYEIVGHLNIDNAVRDTIISLMAQALHFADEVRLNPRLM